MSRPALVVLILAAACARPKPIVYLPTEPPPEGANSLHPVDPLPTTDGTAPTHTDPATRLEFPVPTLPMGMVLHHGILVWTDLAGALWTMPADGASAPKQVSEQHRDGFVAHPFIAGDRVLAKAGKSFLVVTVPAGPVARVLVSGLADLPSEVAGDATTIFLTVAKHDQVMKAPSTGGAAQHLLDAKGAVLAVRGKTLYTASYVTGEVLATPTAGGTPRSIATKLQQPTAIVADDKAVYAYTEGDQRVTRIDLATKATMILAEHLDNSDELVLAGDSLITVSWPNKLMLLPTSSGHTARALADNLFQPRGVVLDDHWIYVTCDKPSRIVRVPRP